MAAAGRGASPSVQIIKAAGVWDNAIAAVGIDQRRCSELGLCAVSGFFCGESPDLAAVGGFYSNARGEVCVLPGRPEGALWSSGTAASAAESSAGHVGLASPYSPFLGKFPPPGPRGAWGRGGGYARGEIDAGARDQSNPAGGRGAGRGNRLGNESRRRAGIPLASGHGGGRTSDNSHTSAEIGLGGLGWGEGVWSGRGGGGGGERDHAVCLLPFLLAWETDVSG